MMHQFITFYDGREIKFSDIFHKDNDQQDYVKVTVERKNEKGDRLDSMYCILPNGKMQDIHGFTEEEVEYHESRIHGLQNIIFECAREKQEI